MLAECKTKTNLGVGVGLILDLSGSIVATQDRALAVWGASIKLVGVVLFILGCMSYAVGKGHSKWLGLLGLLSCVGLLVLIVLPDHNK